MCVLLLQLAYCLASAYKALPAILRDERLRPILTNMATAYVGPQHDGTTAIDKISIAQLDAVSILLFELQLYVQVLCFVCSCE